MRVVQLIDSLEAGGAERMAVNYANSMQHVFGFGALVCTRKEGILTTEIDKNVSYLHLKRKRTFDLGAVLRLKKFIKNHKIEIIQAHSSSYFIAVLVWLLSKNVKIVWHDHYGNSAFLSQRKIGALRFFSRFFSAIIAVNSDLKHWSEENLQCKNVFYLPNFVFFKNRAEATLTLNGVSGKRILLLANLRPQKNHLMLLEIAVKMKLQFPDWTFHLVGKDFEDDYSKQLKHQIENRGLTQSVFLYGSQMAIQSIVNQCSIGVLTSVSEGLPVVLLEYGFFKIPVIVTDVGDVSKVVANNISGYVVPATSSNDFFEKIIELIQDEEKRNTFAANLQKTIFENYTHEAVLQKYQQNINPSA